MEHTFPCGRIALDYVGTLQARRNLAPTERLGSPASLDAWFREAGITDIDSKSDTSDLENALALREAAYSLFAARLSGAEYDPDALALVNHAAEAPPAISQLTASDRHVTASPLQAMSTIARDAIDILGGPDASLLKECGRPECTQVYLDQSRGGRREWCAMETCGNMMKAAAYRARKRAARPASSARSRTRTISA